MILTSPAVLNLCIFLCDAVYNNILEEPYFSSKSVTEVKQRLIEAQDELPFELSTDFCHSCNTHWSSYYVKNASSYTNFFLYTRDSGDNYNVVSINNTESFFEGGFDLQKKTKIVIHGWFDNGTNYMAAVVRKAALEAEDINVISVDWGSVAETLVYSRAVEAVTPVGQYTAELVDFLVTKLAVAPDDIHLIGHSLGAHICGATGEAVTFGQLSRITGLDPAGPGFLFDSDQGRLDASDAAFVDVIHTSIGVAGYALPCGTIDFYPNGGLPTQPGCGIDLTDCPHDRSYYYYAESLSSLGFVATQCELYLEYELGTCDGNPTTVMGEFVNQSASGVYYLDTNSESPFAKGNTSTTKFNN